MNVFTLPLNSYVEALISNVIVLGGGALRRSLGLDKVLRVDHPPPEDGS